MVVLSARHRGETTFFAIPGVTMASPENVSYELLIRTALGWRTHHVYGADQADRARIDVKPLEALSTTEALKIVKVTASSGTEEPNRQTVYQFPKEEKEKPEEPSKPKPANKKPPPKKKRPSGPSPARSERRAARPPRARGKKRISWDDVFDRWWRAISTFFMRMGIGLVVSLIIATMVTSRAVSVLEDVQRIPFVAKETFFVILFLGTFAVCEVTVLWAMAKLRKRKKSGGT